MKANELFTGALVRVNSDGLCIKKGTIVEVRAVDADDKLIEKGLIGSTHCRPLDDNQFDGGIWCKYLDPIPLTPEILEKNGFDGAYKKTYQIYKSKGYDKLYISYWRGRLSIITSPDIRECHSTNRIGVDCKFVHELQHALRLCEIEKEVEL